MYRECKTVFEDGDRITFAQTNNAGYNKDICSAYISGTPKERGKLFEQKLKDSKNKRTVGYVVYDSVNGTYGARVNSYTYKGTYDLDKFVVEHCDLLEE